MTRRRISANVQKAILVNSRRRCVICYGLHRDISIKHGQIAHLDQDPSNNNENNLAFMCMIHHDEYDSTTRQRKNFTLEEVKHYRDELYTAVSTAFDPIPVLGFSGTTQVAQEAEVDHLTGHYILDTDFHQSAELKITRLIDGRFHVSGMALWGTDRPGGPHMGDVDFITELVENVLVYTDDLNLSNNLEQEQSSYAMHINFREGGLVVTELESSKAPFGINVRFAGDYTKVSGLN